MAVVGARRRIRKRTGIFNAISWGIGFVLLAAVVLDTSIELAATLGTDSEGWQFYVGPILVLGTVGLTVLQAINAGSLQPANKDYLLTVRPAKDLVGAQLVLRFCATLPIVFLPIGAMGLGLSIGLGTPLPLVGAVVATLLVNAVGTTIGVPLGLVVRGLGQRSAVSAWYAVIAAVPIFLGYVVFLYVGGISMAVEFVRVVVGGSPLAWFGDVALSTTPGSVAVPLNAFVAVVVSMLFCGLMVRASVRAAEFTWYADGSRQSKAEGDDSEAPEQIRIGLGTVLEAISGSPATRGVATVSLRRSYRSPFVLLVLVTLALVSAIPIVESLVVTRTVPWYAPWLVLYYGGIIAGVQHALNVIGSQGPTLPVLLTARASPREIVNGHVLGAAVVYAPITTLFATLLAVAAGWGLTSVALTATAAPVAVVSAVVVAAAVGVRFPRFRSFQMHDVVGHVPPNLFAVLVFSTIYLLTVATIAALVAVLSRLPTVDWWTALAVGAALAVIGCGVAAYRYAVHSVATYHIE